MREFFEGWRRKAGLVTLAMACVFVGGSTGCVPPTGLYNGPGGGSTHIPPATIPTGVPFTLKSEVNAIGGRVKNVRCVYSLNDEKAEHEIVMLPEQAISDSNQVYRCRLPTFTELGKVNYRFVWDFDGETRKRYSLLCRLFDGRKASEVASATAVTSRVNSCLVMSVAVGQICGFWPIAEALSSISFLPSQYSSHPQLRDICSLDTKAACSMGPLYVVIRHESVFDRIAEVTAAETLIGRDGESAIRLPDPCISREHALLLNTATGVRIRDLGSRNGTRVGGQLIRREEVLGEGTHVRLGPYQLTVCFSFANALRESASINDESTHSEDFVADVNSETEHRLSQLTPTQRRVYDRFLEGLFEKEVATALGISIHTVHDHAKAIYKVFAVSSRGELIADWAKRQGRRTLEGS